MGSKVIISIGLLLAMVILISSEVSARDLAETSNAIDASTVGLLPGSYGPAGGYGSYVPIRPPSYGGGPGGYGGGRGKPQN